MAQDITQENFDTLVNKSEKPVVLDFWAPWCGPCRMLIPIINELAEEMKEQVNIFKCNIDDAGDLPAKYGIRSVPTIILFKGGQVVDMRTGASSKKDLQEWIENNS